MEDAIALAESFQQSATVSEALSNFTTTRRPIIQDYQSAAFDSMVWFENAREYMHLTPLELAYTLMTRSGRVSYEDLKRRDPDFIRAYESAADNTE
jgi:anthraniloyl-CoA monooxygenase